MVIAMIDVAQYEGHIIQIGIVRTRICGAKRLDDLVVVVTAFLNVNSYAVEAFGRECTLYNIAGFLDVHLHSYLHLCVCLCVRS